MNDTLVINVKAETSSIVAAEKELGSFQKSVNSVNVSIKQAQDKWSQWSSITTAVSTAFKAVHLAITNYIIAPLAGAVNGFMALGDQISKTSQKIGIGTETLGGLKFAAEQCGANFQILTEGIKAFQNQLGAAQMGDTGAISKLGKVGLNANDFAGLSNEDQLMKLADHIKAIGDKSEQTRVAMELFGKAGFKLLPFFQEGSEGIRKLIDEGKDIGAVLGEDSIQSAVELTDAMNRMKTSAANVSNVFIASLAPAITSVLDGITSLAKGTSRFVKNSAVLITGIGASVAAFAALRAMVLGATTVIPALVAGFNALKVAMLSNPYLLAGAAIIGGIVAAWAMWNKAIKETEQRLKVMNEEAQKHEQAVLAANAADKKLFDRLQELADMEDPLNNEEVREAQALIDELEGKYGKLGITIDENTRKIHGMAQAQAILNKEMAQKELDALEERKKAVDAKISDLEAKRDAAYATYEKAYNENERRKGKKGYYSQTGFLNRKKRDEALKQYKEYVAELGGLIDERTGLSERQKALRGITNPEEATEPGKPQEQPKTLSQLNEESTAARNAQNEAKAELAKMKEDPDLDFRDPLTKAYADLEAKAQEKYAALDKRIELTKKAGGEGVEEKVAELEAEYAKIEQWRLQEQEKIGQGVIDERQKEADAEYSEWKEQNPELKAHFDTEEIEEKKQAVEDAKQKEADAILAGDLEAARKAREEADAANIELAKAVATASGAKRTEAAQKVADAKAEYDQAKKEGANNKTLNELYEKYEKALAQKEQADREYYEAVGTVQAGLKTQEEKVQDAVQTSLSASGTFSVYGMDAAVQVNVTQEILVTLQKIYGVTDKMEKNQGNESVYTEKK